jgi:hypothetical protein
VFPAKRSCTPAALTTRAFCNSGSSLFFNRTGSALFGEQLPKSSSLLLFSLLNLPLISHCFYVEATTIGFTNYPITAVTRSRAIVKPVAEPSEVKATVYSGEEYRASARSSMFRLTSVSVEPPESHPVDRLLPQSRLQQMKKLLQLAAVAYPNKAKR